MNYSIFSNSMRSPGYHHVKAEVLRFPKMWYFLSVAVFKGELLAVKVGSNSKKITGAVLPFPKKVTATILIFQILHRISQWCWLHADSVVGLKNQNCGRNFFFCERQCFSLMDPKFHALLTLRSTNSTLKTPKKCHIFGKLRT